MSVITLPDGSVKEFDGAISVFDVAKSIGSGLAKAAIAGKVDDRLVDLSRMIEGDAHLAIITSTSDEGLEIIRHSTAHLLAQAVQLLFPEARLAIGPVIENGFYYDFSYPKGFSEEDLQRIEEKMRILAKEGQEVSREVMTREQALEFFAKQGEKYKVEIINELPEEGDITIYKQSNFADLCRGPHVPNTRFLKAFRLTKLAGAYWRGDSKNEMLQRIYGTAWADKKALDAYLERLAEAEKRDHRRLATKLDLFHFQEEAPGMVFWHPDGWTVYRQVEDYIRQKYVEYGYQEIRTPFLVDRSLWEASGHWDKFGKEMFVTESENRLYAIKPMNCPCHVQVFKQGLKSYRDLPLRLAEFGACHRNELSGALHGLMRVRQMVQDDGHIFCTEDQVPSEVARFLDQVFAVYKDFGFDDILLKLATRPDERVGSDELWDKAENSLKTVLENKNLMLDLNVGEGAFYGPKLEISLRDSIGRIWQCGTIQLDFSMPARLGAYYIAEDGTKRTPVMLHRAMMGSLERFIGILLEHTGGSLPVWLAPTQVVVSNITDHQASYAEEITEILKNLGVRVKSDLRNEKIGFKIREHAISRVPYLLILGDREVADQRVTVRTRDGADLGSMSMEDFVARVQSDIAQRG